jgi:hypothetical protein
MAYGLRAIWWVCGMALVWGNLSHAQSLASPLSHPTPAPSARASGASAPTDSTPPAPTPTPGPVSSPAPLEPAAAAPNPSPAASSDDTGDAAPMSDSDFVVSGVPYAKVLYLEGNVWIKSPDDSTYHKLTEDEPIPAQSQIHTGFNGTLDFATGPGMAVRMTPATGISVDSLPQPAPTATTATPAPASASQISVKRGMVFSALGRSDGQPIDFKVRTPQGVAGARGTMFSTTVIDGESQVSMLHGTVNFETPDHQTSQITAGQSQRVSGSGGRFKMGERQSLNPGASESYFNHAGGLLEHASGYGVVRRSLGPDVAKTLDAKGYKFPHGVQERFQNAAKAHYQRRPAFNRSHGASSATAGTGLHKTTPGAATPGAKSSSTTKTYGEHTGTAGSATHTPAATTQHHELTPEEKRKLLRRNQDGAADKGDHPLRDHGGN